MSPEQVRGEPLDRRTDLFSFGVVLYEMATGTLRPRERGAAVRSVRDSCRVPAELARIISKVPRAEIASRRYQHASEIRTDLQRLKQRHGLGAATAIATP